MKIIKLSHAQMVTLENLGVDPQADILIPPDKGPGNYSQCESCNMQKIGFKDDGVVKGCRAPIPSKQANYHVGCSAYGPIYLGEMDQAELALWEVT